MYTIFLYEYIYIYLFPYLFNSLLINQLLTNSLHIRGYFALLHLQTLPHTLEIAKIKLCKKKNDILRHMNSASFKFTHSIITKANAGDEINKGQIFLCTGISTGNLWYVHVFLHMTFVCYYWGMKKKTYTFFGKLELDFLIE